MKLCLVRHGETDHNRRRLVQGQSQQCLTKLSLKQATAAARILNLDEIVALYSSPLKRAVETASAIQTNSTLAHSTVHNLSELNVGELDGLSSQEMRDQYPKFMAAWDRNSGEAQLPGGESLAQVQSRAWEWVIDVAEQHTDGQVVAVSHNFTISTLICQVLKLPISSFRQFRVDLGSISAIEVTKSQHRLLLLNSTFHLNALGS